jgi:uncharacterized damage-inducible protein DinB
MSHDTDGILTPAALLEHWQGHRCLTRRVTAAFPEEHFASYHAPGMRTFAELMSEVLGLVEPTLRNLLGEGWDWPDSWAIETKSALLEAWDEATATLEETWKRIPTSRFHEVEEAFGMPPQEYVKTILYLIDNEIHHRAQGYVYLRLFGVEPPAFYER